MVSVPDIVDKFESDVIIIHWLGPVHFIHSEGERSCWLPRHLDGHESIVPSELPTAGHRILDGDLSYTGEGSARSCAGFPRSPPGVHPFWEEIANAWGEELSHHHF